MAKGMTESALLRENAVLNERVGELTDALNRQMAINADLTRQVGRLSEDLNRQIAVNAELVRQVAENNTEIKGLRADLKDADARYMEKELEKESEAKARKEAEEGMAKLERKVSGLNSLLSNGSEKRRPAQPASAEEWKKLEDERKEARKARKNNGAKRDMHLEAETVDVFLRPDLDAETLKRVKWLGTREVTRYSVVPPRMIKTVYHIDKGLLDGRILEAPTPRTPYLNSNYDASFSAFLAYCRFSLGLPVERIVRQCSDFGFDLDKATAHNLLRLTAELLGPVHELIGEEVKESSSHYIKGDETYHPVQLYWSGERRVDGGKMIRKGYVWALQDMAGGQEYLFYDNGSRSQEVLTKEMEGYSGTVQSDAFRAYGNLAKGSGGKITNINCIQHGKRKMVAMKGNPDADRIVDKMNMLYREEHKHKVGVDGWTVEDNLKWRREYAPPLLEDLKADLLSLKSDPRYTPKSQMAQAVNYILNIWGGIEGIFTRGDYDLDSNSLEVTFRGIAQSRKSSLFFGSHEGAKRAAVFYSLAISCRNLGINFFEYMEDVIRRASELPAAKKKDEWDERYKGKWKALTPYNWKMEKQGEAE